MFRLRTTILVVVVGCQLSVVSCFAQTKTQVRVAIIEDAQSVSLKVNGFYEIIDTAKHKVLSRGKALSTTIVVCKDGIIMGGRSLNCGNIIIKTADPEALIINGRKLRGDIQFIRKDNLRIMVVNRIGLEDYVKGVSVREISHYWPEEALEAGVIVFRTFALYKIEEGRGREYDLTSDVYSQVYGGRAAERYRINKAVDDTKGIVLTYRGKIFPAFYHATCAGHTEDASILWNIDIPPLKGVPCNFCRDSPHFSWHNVLTLDEIGEKLKNSDYKAKDIKDIKIAGRDNSGRITNLRVVAGDKEIDVLAKDFRNIMGPDIIKSTNFEVSLADHDVVFEGLGWGHGVGLCEWGAYFMAKEGYKYTQILKYYYPGAAVETLRF